MAEGWCGEEWDARRRLVQFTRRQNGSTIHADFKGIAPEDRPPNSITISCIWWEEKQECYVTSVDTIFLLESLVAVRFTVEEKNRIRRNLEGFRPLTVSKSKSDSEEFFKVVMGFPNPKPRNIEKDVKVFPWKILAHALKKIISKYSASYSSTASAILTPATSAYASTEASVDHLSSASPSLDTVATSMVIFPSTSSTAYTPQMAHVPTAMSAPAMATQTLRHHLDTLPPQYALPTAYALPGLPQMSPLPMSQPSTQVTHAQTAESMSASASRIPCSWDFSNFVHTSPSSMTPYEQMATKAESQSYPPATYSIHPTTSTT